jgi:hypothetical protein
MPSPRISLFAGVWVIALLISRSASSTESCPLYPLGVTSQQTNDGETYYASAFARPFREDEEAFMEARQEARPPICECTTRPTTRRPVPDGGLSGAFCTLERTKRLGSLYLSMNERSPSSGVSTKTLWMRSSNSVRQIAAPSKIREPSRKRQLRMKVCAVS